MTEKLKMEQDPMSPVLETIKQVCPAAVNDNGTIDFDVLKSELSDSVVEGQRERYEFDWVGKENAIREYKRKIRKTLRPVVEDSKNWETTQNLYIEGDNLDALKLLQKSYLHKVKMIYIDPPYNTGNDFVYCDDFAEDCKQYLDKKEVCDADGNRLFVNKRDNGQYHSNWCSMMYPRLKLARDLLSDDGLIFISIDDHEQANLKKICDEIFGEGNFIAQFNWMKTSTPPSLSKNVRKKFEYVLCYAKKQNDTGLNGGIVEGGDMPLLNDGNSFGTLVFPKDSVVFKIPDGKYKAGQYDRVSLEKDIIVENGKSITDVELSGNFKWQQSTLNEEVKAGTVFRIKTERFAIRYERSGERIKVPSNVISKEECNVGTNEDAQKDIISLFNQKIMDYPKPVSLLKYVINMKTSEDDIVLDFFSGSATTAHAIMRLNAEDGGCRKFIMVQLPEPTAEDSEAFKAGYKNICEIGKERIRRAGDKIVAETGRTDLDIGFRVLRIDLSNMKEVYYKPSDTKQSGLLDLVDNIEDGRTDMDLLFGVMVDCGLPLNMPIETKTSHGKTYYVVNNADLIACFEDSISEDLIREIAKQKPICAVFKDFSFAEAKDKVNV